MPSRRRTAPARRPAQARSRVRPLHRHGGHNAAGAGRHGDEGRATCRGRISGGTRCPAWARVSHACIAFSGSGCGATMRSHEAAPLLAEQPCPRTSCRPQWQARRPAQHADRAPHGAERIACCPTAGRCWTASASAFVGGTSTGSRCFPGSEPQKASTEHSHHQVGWESGSWRTDAPWWLALRGHPPPFGSAGSFEAVR